jgi:hypothetical protein
MGFWSAAGATTTLPAAKSRGHSVVESLVVGAFLALVSAFAITEYLMAEFDARRRILVGEDQSLLVIVAANLASLAILLAGAIMFVAASGAEAYFQAAVVCALAQAPWFCQHLWAYYRDHLRLSYEQ